ncbi:unnamed protein product [Anisakis simplex]|uniref:ATP-dependent RNA helicase n=1 Tax=Anisakis simplex TaxID=6269 RepID=A0A3P6R0L4_ANISI|nr:unnamed protein product [Anisakis simplex]
MIDANLVELDAVSGLHPRLRDVIHATIQRWFPVQYSILPHLIAETVCPPLLPPRDLAISSPTGSGKTLCYILPILNSLSYTSAKSLHALIVAPVQNLVAQIESEFNKFNVFKMKTALLCGGANNDINSQRRQLKDARVVFATPGRLIEHLVDPQSPIDVTHLRYLVIDEADRMSQSARLEWLDALENAAHLNTVYSSFDNIARTGSYLQKILVSATLSRDVEKLHVWRLRYPRLFRATAKHSEEIRGDESVLSLNQTTATTDQIVGATILPSSLTHRVVVCEANVKPLALYIQLQKHSQWKRILVFANNKLASNRLAVLLNVLASDDFRVEELSANLFGHRRHKVLNRFKKGATRVLIASDVISRGIDVQDIDAVINYDKPSTERLFIHRVGRTARCGRQGVALSLTTNQERDDLKNMLSKTGCWRDVEEEKLELTTDDPLQTKYRHALGSLKEVIEKRNVKVI